MSQIKFGKAETTQQKTDDNTIFLYANIRIGSDSVPSEKIQTYLKMQIKNTTQRKAALQEVENIINQYGWVRMPPFEKAIVDEKQKAIHEFDKKQNK